MTTPGASWTLESPPGAGAIAIIQLHGDIDWAFAACGIIPVGVREVKLRELMDIDRGVVGRWSMTSCQLMVHGGAAVVRAVCAELVRRGIAQEHTPEPRVMYPEARSEVEARALAALARAASPLAVDMLLAQHELWAQPGAASDPTRDCALNRLIDPPLVVALGASNIGKSTLVNALAGRGVSVVADEPGTTRDHVGVMLDLGGVVVRYVDTPGLRAGAGEVEREAVAAAMAMARVADLLLVCGDSAAAPPELPPELEGRERVALALRTDLGHAAFRADVHVSAKTGAGLAELVTVVRERLVPAGYINDDRAWKFWE
jgi:hypothetical protein